MQASGSGEDGLLEGASELSDAIEKTAARTIEDVTMSLTRYQFHNAISFLIKHVNDLTSISQKTPSIIAHTSFKEALSIHARLLFPLAPHIASEIWSFFHTSDLAHQPWPTPHVPHLRESNKLTIAIQLNGRHKASLILPPNEVDSLQEAELDHLIRTRSRALLENHLAQHTAIKEVKVIQRRAINFII